MIKLDAKFLSKYYRDMETKVLVCSLDICTSEGRGGLSREVFQATDWFLSQNCHRARFCKIFLRIKG